MGKPRVSAETEQRVLDYIKDEPSFTVSFAAWDMSQNGKRITRTAVQFAITQMLERHAIALRLIEDAGRSGKVFAYVEPKPARYVSGSLPELDAHRHAVLADLAPERGAPVPHTGRPHLEGPYGKGLKARRNLAKRRRAA